MSRVLIALVNIAFRGDPSGADVVTDYLDGTRVDWRGAWGAAKAVAPHSNSPIGRMIRLFREVQP